jgi:hypothetical protein
VNLAWLVALLRPEDIAPHPNVPDPDYDRQPQSALAAVVLGDPRRSGQLGALFRQSGRGDEGENGSSLAEAALKSFSASSIYDGVSELRRRATDPDSDLAEATAAALLAACALSELEQHGDAVGVLQSVLVRVENDDSDGAALLRLTLLLQLSLRMRDWNEDFREALALTRELLARLNPVVSFDQFPIGPAATGSSDDTIKHILRALTYSSWSLGSFGRVSDDKPPTVEELVQHPRSEQLLLLEEDAAAVYARSLEEQYGRLFGDSSIVIGRSSPDLFYVSLRHELLGSTAALTARRNLAIYRLVRGRSSSETADYRDCLRLLRYSANADDELDLAINEVRLAGPLSALSEEVRRVIVHRLSPEYVRYSELSIVHAAAELLTPSEASATLNQVIRLIERKCPFNAAGRWTAYSRRLSETWRTATALARYADRMDELANFLLDEIERSDPSDEAIDLAYARAISAIEWSQVTSVATRRWGAWADRGQTGWPRARDAIRVNLGVRVASWDISQELTLSEVGDVLNDAFRGHPMPSGFLERANAVVIESLENLEAASTRGGPFGMGGTEPASCAAVLISHGSSQLWDPLAKFLTNTRVPRTYRTAGFDQLVDLGMPLPAAIFDRIQSDAARILVAPDTLPYRNDDLVPYPSALRFLGRYELLNQGDILANVMRLAGATDVKARVEAAKTLAVLAGVAPAFWMSAVAIQLSHDRNGEILGYCANALALLLGDDNPLGEATSARLIELLKADGMIAPLLAIRGLKRSLSLEGPVGSEVRHLARNHPSRLVRDEAVQVLAAEE